MDEPKAKLECAICWHEIKPGEKHATVGDGGRPAHVDCIWVKYRA
jgi:hypothetical protein